ncbi:MAG TPA: hypothetical protein VHK63_02140, partial [Candidatus Limnocylindria bacterium]|nr:hypothetical protein [Candidatus Limnocylindria bacterium]
MRRRRMISAISVLTLTASMLLALGFAPGVAGATELRFCGKVDVYTRPTALLAGTLKVGPVLLVLAPGADVSSRVEVGANLCFDATINASGKVTDLDVRANATSSLTVCGVVTSLARATASATGSITINGVHRILAIGSDLPATVRQGANLCVDFTLNAFGQVSRATARANATSTLNICGRVTAFAAASNTSTGSLTLGGRTFRLAVGADLPASVRAGANLCMALELNALGQVSGGSARANVTTTVTVCGQVNAVVAATATSDGRLVIDDLPRSIAAGERLSAQVRAGAFVRLRLTLDAFGRITDDVVLAVGVSRAAACGSGGAPSPSASPSAG